MKSILVILSLFSINAFAALNCVSINKPGYSVIAVSKVGEPSMLTAQLQGKDIYRMPVVEVPASSGFTMQSLDFLNERSAPAYLFLNIYAENGKILGHLHEGSYLPVVPGLRLECTSR